MKSCICENPLGIYNITLENGRWKKKNSKPYGNVIEDSPCVPTIQFNLKRCSPQED